MEPEIPHAPIGFKEIVVTHDKARYVALGFLILIITAGIVSWTELALQPKSSPPPMVTESKNWKTYRNDEYGFEFKYPAYFFRPVLTEDDEIVFQTNSSQDDGLVIKIFKRSGGFHIDEFFFGCTYDKITNTWTTNTKSTTTQCPTSYMEKDGVRQFIYDVDDGREWEVDGLIDSEVEFSVNIAVQGGQGSKNNAETLASILSTFKFTK
jgi:hypothetical protein